MKFRVIGLAVVAVLLLMTGCRKTVIGEEQRGENDVKAPIESENSGVDILEPDENEEPTDWVEYEGNTQDIYEEVKITFGGDEMPLDAVLTLPAGSLPKEIVILIHDFGQYDMDETIGASDNKPLRDIAWGLAREGIASIRYNKRYYQYPEQMSEDITIQDEVLEDASHAIMYARSDSRLTGCKIIINGHSLGGMLAPKIALDNIEVAGIISMAGTPRRLEEVLHDQNKSVIEDLYHTEEERAELLNQLQADTEKVKDLERWDAEGTVMGFTKQYWASLNEIDIASICQELNVPMLILHGEEDYQMNHETDYNEWKSILNEKNNVSFKLYDNLNHLMMPYCGKRDITEYDAKSHVSDEVIRDMSNWIRQL